MQPDLICFCANTARASEQAASCSCRGYYQLTSQMNCELCMPWQAGNKARQAKRSRFIDDIAAVDEDEEEEDEEVQSHLLAGLMTGHVLSKRNNCSHHRCM